MCNCKNVAIGSYDNQVELRRPDHMFGRSEGTESDTICIDKCLESEISFLWANGIITTGCCCGHNLLPPYIGVIEEHIPIMQKMGYKTAYNPAKPDGKDSFYPKLTR